MGCCTTTAPSDYWYVPFGPGAGGPPRPAVGGPTDGASTTLEIGPHDHRGVYIPPGVAHGFYALTDMTITYLVDNYYDPADELGVAWDDPALAIDGRTARRSSPSAPLNPLRADIRASCGPGTGPEAARPDRRVPDARAPDARAPARSAEAQPPPRGCSIRARTRRARLMPVVACTAQWPRPAAPAARPAGRAPAPTGPWLPQDRGQRRVGEARRVGGPRGWGGDRPAATRRRSTGAGTGRSARRRRRARAPRPHTGSRTRGGTRNRPAGDGRHRLVEAEHIRPSASSGTQGPVTAP